MDKEFSGLIVVADTVKKSYPEAISALNDLGIEAIMLTGDNEKVAIGCVETRDCNTSVTNKEYHRMSILSFLHIRKFYIICITTRSI